MDSSLPGSSVHGILQARILECVATPFSRGSSQPRDQNRVSCIAGRLFITWVTREDFRGLSIISGIFCRVFQPWMPISVTWRIKRILIQPGPIEFESLVGISVFPQVLVSVLAGGFSLPSRGSVLWVLWGCLFPRTLYHQRTRIFIQIWYKATYLASHLGCEVQLSN